MEYLSTREAAERRGVSLRHVQRLLHENRIPGARKYGVSWLIPADADKPPDLRGVETTAPARTAPERTPCAPAPGCSLFPLLHIRAGDLAGGARSWPPRCTKPRRSRSSS